jgi:hypothetical protein
MKHQPVVKILEVSGYTSICNAFLASRIWLCTRSFSIADMIDSPKAAQEHGRISTVAIADANPAISILLFANSTIALYFDTVLQSPEYLTGLFCKIIFSPFKNAAFGPPVS